MNAAGVQPPTGNVVNLSVKYRFVIAKAKPEAIHSSWIASLRSQL
jgi:hypothetical protein